MIHLKQAALKVLAEVRASRALKAATYRKNFGDRMTKALEAETTEMENEVEALDTVIAAINDDKVF